MKNKLYYLFLGLLMISVIPKSWAQTTDKEAINNLLDNWHKAAADSNFDAYFSALTDDSIFIGTDPTEIWDKAAFKNYAKSAFEQKKGWNFKSIQRNIYFDKTGNIAWFDELLDTSMKICRGSGVLEKVNGQWKIKQYVLSMTIPNDDVKAVVKLVEPKQDEQLKKYLNK